MKKRLIVALIAIAPALILTGCGATRRQLSGHELKLLAAVDPREISPGRYLVGWVMYTPPGAGSQVQPIAIEMDEPYIEWPQFGVRQLDVNFDGSPDIGVRQHKGAKWGRTYWWLYDPNKSRFYTNSLTEELKKLVHSSFTADSDSRTITVTLLEGVEVMETTYNVVNDHLEPVESDEP